MTALISLERVANWPVEGSRCDAVNQLHHISVLNVHWLLIHHKAVSVTKTTHTTLNARVREGARDSDSEHFISQQG
jgi:hypothetical protein